MNEFEFGVIARAVGDRFANGKPHFVKSETLSEVCIDFDVFTELLYRFCEITEIGQSSSVSLCGNRTCLGCRFKCNGVCIIHALNRFHGNYISAYSKPKNPLIEYTNEQLAEELKRRMDA